MAIFGSLRLRFILALVIVAMIPIGTVAFMIDRATKEAFRSYAAEQDTVNTKSLAEQVGELTDYQVYVTSSGSGITAASGRGGGVAGVASGGGSGGRFENQPDDIPVSDASQAAVSGSYGVNLPSAGAAPNGFSGSGGTTAAAETSALAPMGVGGSNANETADAEPESVSVSLPGIPDKAFLGEVNHALWIAVGIAGASALLLAIVLARSIVRPVEQLTSAARGMSQGDLERRVAVRSPHEIGVLASAFNSMAESRQQLDGLRRNLVNDVAHELRTPLANLQGYLEVLRDGLTEPTQEILAVLHDESLLLNGLVADLQEMALAEAGQLPLLRVPVEISEPIENAIEAIKPQADARHLTIESNVDESLPEVLVDTSRLSQILRNLLRNAVTHTPPGGHIDVQATTTANLVKIAVRDTGHGIEPEHLPYIFDRFYRADRARARDTGGSGLGLAVVKNLVEAHGGTINVCSVVNTGTTFTFTLPIAANVIEAVAS